MVVVGLTGVSGSGKGYVSDLFAARGVPSIDTDAVTHALYAPGSGCVCELVAAFGGGILATDGSVNRAALGQIVFHSEEALSLLDRIVHRFVLEEVRHRLADYAESGTRIVLVDAPQLFESGFDSECSCTIAVVASPEVCIERICRRDGIDRERAVLRLRNQHDVDFFRKRCDFVIENNGTELLSETVDRILEKLECAVCHEESEA